MGKVKCKQFHKYHNLEELWEANNLERIVETQLQRELNQMKEQRGRLFPKTQSFMTPASWELCGPFQWYH